MAKRLCCGFRGKIYYTDVNKKEAIKKAYKECSGPMDFVGNGGYDKLIGVCDTDNANVSIACDDEVEYTDVEEID